MMFGRGLNSNTMITEDTRDEMVQAFRQFLGTYDQTRARIDWIFERVGYDKLQGLTELAKRVEALEQWRRDREIRQAVPSKPPAEPAPTRPLQVGDRVRNAAGTDTGEVKEICLDGDATINWDSGYGGHTDYNPVSLQHYRSPSHPDYGHVVLLEPDFDTQAREAGYVKAEEVLRRLDDEGGMPYSSPMPLPELRGWLRAQAKGGAK